MVEFKYIFLVGGFAVLCAFIFWASENPDDSTRFWGMVVGGMVYGTIAGTLMRNSNPH